MPARQRKGPAAAASPVSDAAVSAESPVARPFLPLLIVSDQGSLAEELSRDSRLSSLPVILTDRPINMKLILDKIYEILAIK